MNLVLWLVLIAMTLLGAVASLMLKLASDDLRFPALLKDWHLWAGGVGYLLAALLNVWVLRHLDLSVVLPLTALTYVWTLVIARVVLSEAITRTKVVGVLLILVGVVLISQT